MFLLFQPFQKEIHPFFVLLWFMLIRNHQLEYWMMVSTTKGDYQPQNIYSLFPHSKKRSKKIGSTTEIDREEKKKHLNMQIRVFVEHLTIFSRSKRNKNLNIFFRNGNLYVFFSFSPFDMVLLLKFEKKTRRVVRGVLKS